jgi:hypothetical protein
MITQKIGAPHGFDANSVSAPPMREQSSPCPAFEFCQYILVKISSHCMHMHTMALKSIISLNSYFNRIISPPIATFIGSFHHHNELGTINCQSNDAA